MVCSGQIMDCISNPMLAYEKFMAMCGYRTDYWKHVLDIGSYVVIMLAVLEFVGLNLIRFPVPYGRYASKTFGPLIPAKMAWFACQLPSLLVPAYVWSTSEHKTGNVIAYMLLSLFLLHYVIKVFVHPAIIHGERPMPLIPFLIATVYCAGNSYLQAKYLVVYGDYGFGWFAMIRHLVGAALFFAGMGINLHSDNILSNLSKNTTSSQGKIHTENNAMESNAGQHHSGRKCRGSGDHQEESMAPADAAGPGASHEKQHPARLAIPHGGLFEYVSCANYFGEIMEWFGWALMAWSLPALAHFLFSCGNLIPRGIQHHKDYQHKFRENYPAGRFAVIPFIV